MKLVATLNIEYSPNGVDALELQRMLEESLQSMISNGGLTGHTEAEAESYEIKTELVEEFKDQ
ncbi:hypothetical protein ACI2KR_31440 [Pseudomonas luteola]